MKIKKIINSSLVTPVFILSLVGIIYSFETQGSVQAFIEQISFVVIGFLVMLILSGFNHENFRKYSVFLLVTVIVLLTLVLIPAVGMKINGARRWIDFRVFSFQPSEFAKLALILFLAHWLESEEKRRNLAFFLLFGFIFILIMLEPDMGTGLIILTIGFSMFLISKSTQLLKFLAALPLVLLIIFLYVRTSDYRFARLTSFLGNEQNGRSYHANQALVSVGSGGIFGVGIGKSKQKYSYLPENSTDSIFGIIAEETGFLGSAGIVTCYFLIFYHGFLICRKTKNTYGKFISFGIVMFILSQAYINFSAMLSLIPLTGVPLPLISSGGSAILVQFAAIGILLNISEA